MKMKRTNRWIFLLLASVLFCVMASYACAEDKDVEKNSTVKKVFTLSFASYNQFVEEMKIIGNTASNPAFAATIDGPIRFYLGNDIMKAVNLDGQIGFVLMISDDGESPIPILVLPIADTDALIDFMTAKDEDLEYTVREDGIVEWKKGFQTVYLKGMNKWTYLTLDESLLPTDENAKPEDILGPMNGEAVQINFNFENLPQELKTLYTKNLEEGMKLALEKQEGENDEDYALRKEVAETQMKIARDTMEALTTFSWGVHVDADAKAIKTTLNINVKPESEFMKLMKRLESLNTVSTSFAQVPGMFRGYGVSVNTPENLKVSKLALKQSFKDMRNALEEEKDDENYSAFVELLNLAEEMVFSLIPADGVQCSGFLMDAEMGDYNMIIAVENQKRETIREIFQKAVALAKKELDDDFNENWVKTDVKTENGLVFDTLTLSTETIVALLKNLNKEAEELAEKELELIKKATGNQISLIVGGNDTQVWVGLGTNPLAKVATCANNKKTQVAGEFRMDLRKIFAFIEQCAGISVEFNEYTMEKLKLSEETKTANAEESEEDSENVSERLVEELAEIDEETPSERKETLEKNIESAEKTQMQMGVLLEILDGTDKTDMVLDFDSTETGMVIRLNFEEGITRILGMLPSLIMMRAM